MTLPNTGNKNIFIGDGATSVFSYTFRIFAASDLEVVVNDLITDTTLVLTTNYTVSGVGASAGGLVTLLGPFAPLTSLHTITIRRVLPLTQLTDLRNQGSYLPENVEDQFDRLVMMIQQQGSNEEINIKLPATETGDAAKTTVPSVADRLSKVFGWDAAGNIIAIATVPTSGVTATAFMETVLDDADAITARNTLFITQGGVATSQSTQRDDYPIASIAATRSIFQQPASANFSISGFSTLFDTNTQRRLVFMNTSTFDETLLHDNVGSSSAHRILCPGGVDLVIPPEGVAVLDYDITTNKWRVTTTSFPHTEVVVKAGAYTLLTSDSGSVFSNEGAAALAVYALPTARVGLQYTFVVQDVDGIQLNVAAGDTVRSNGGVTTAGGATTSTVIGDSVTIVAINATEWMAIAQTGANWGFV